jgi:hypothetical protein
MKRCPQCNSTFSDPSLNFCVSDGTPLTSDAPRFDAEAETLKNVPKQPEMSPQDIIMEVANYLRSTVRPGHQVLIRFDQVNASGLTPAQVSEHFEAAAEKAGCEVVDKTDTRATVRREPARLVRA